MTPVVPVIMYYFSNPYREQYAIATRLLNYLLFAIGLLPYYLLPLWAGTFVDDYGFTGSQLGPLLAADMAGGTIAAVCARYWIAEVRWQPVLVVSLLACVGVNLACAGVEDFGGMLALRSAAGLAVGTFMAIVYADFSHAENPNREFAIAMAAQVAFGAAAIWLAPVLQLNWGPAGSFLAVGFATLIPLLLTSSCPQRQMLTDQHSPRSTISIRVWLGIATICLFFVALSCVWVAMERLAVSAGLDAPVISNVLSAALLFSFLGAAAPALATGLARRRIQVMLSYAALVIAIIVIGNEPVAWVLAGGLAVYNFFYSFVIPYQAAWVSESDSTGRNAVLVPVAQGIGVTVGPILGGVLLGAGNYAGVIYASIGILAISFGCAYFAGDPIED